MGAAAQPSSSSSSETCCLPSLFTHGAVKVATHVDPPQSPSHSPMHTTNHTPSVHSSVAAARSASLSLLLLPPSKSACTSKSHAGDAGVHAPRCQCKSRTLNPPTPTTTEACLSCVAPQHSRNGHSGLHHQIKCARCTSGPAQVVLPQCTPPGQQNSAPRLRRRTEVPLHACMRTHTPAAWRCHSRQAGPKHHAHQAKACTPSIATGDTPFPGSPLPAEPGGALERGTRQAADAGTGHFRI